jgi:hypothetical protein
MGLFPIIISESRLEEIEYKAFRLGYSAGYESGVKDGQDQKCEQTGNVTSEEYVNLMNYLVDNGLEIVYSQNHSNGFTFGLQVRKMKRP